MQLQAICAIVKALTHGYCLRCYQLEYAGQLCTTGSILSLVPRPYSWDPGWINIVIITLLVGEKLCRVIYYTPGIGKIVPRK